MPCPAIEGSVGRDLLLRLVCRDMLDQKIRGCRHRLPSCVSTPDNGVNLIDSNIHDALTLQNLSPARCVGNGRRCGHMALDACTIENIDFVILGCLEKRNINTVHPLPIPVCAAPM